MADVTNVLSFDLEHWHSATLLAEHVTDPVDHVRQSTEIVLTLLDRHDVRATFFVVGRLAREHPDLLREIEAAGHEVGSHGHTHTPLFDLDPEAFRRELRRSAEAIEAAVDEPVLGFRAPNFSVTRETSWALEVLREEGYRYDSSVFPVRTPMYGVSGAPVRPYRPTPDRPFDGEALSPSDGQESLPPGEDGDSLVELPLAVAHPTLRVPIAGGFYARTLPTWLLRLGIRTLNGRGIPATFNFHPWEFNPDVRTRSVPRHVRFVSFHGIDRTATKLDALLEAFEFGPARDVAPAPREPVRGVA